MLISKGTGCFEGKIRIFEHLPCLWIWTWTAIMVIRGDSVPLFLGGAGGWCSGIIYIQLLSTNSQKGVSKYTEGAK